MVVDPTINIPLNPTAALWCLVGKMDDARTVRRLPILASPFTIGRGGDRSLVLHSRAISSQHAELIQIGDHLFVRDASSTNGTYVNGKRVQGLEPLNRGDLLQVADIVFRIDQNSVNSNSATDNIESVETAFAILQFERLMSQRAVCPHFQPVVTLDDSPQTIGYELLGRSRLHGLTSPAQMFKIAAQLSLEAELSILLRDEGLAVSRAFPPDVNIFVNTHPRELDKPEQLARNLKAVREQSPDQKITVEVHEATVADVSRMRDLRSLVQDLQMQLAYDDFGAGQARLVELIEVPPDYLKFDRQLVRDINMAPGPRQKSLEMLVRMSGDLGIKPLAEGIETPAEADCCRQLGFKLAQGYHFGKPNELSVWLPGVVPSSPTT